MAATTPKRHPGAALWQAIALAAASVALLAVLSPSGRKAEDPHGNPPVEMASVGEAAPYLKRAAARILADSRSHATGPGTFEPKPAVPAQLGGSSSAVRHRPAPPSGYSYTPVVHMTTGKLPAALNQPVQQAGLTGWLDPRSSRALLQRQAESAGRDWTFAWLRQSGGVPLEKLRSALEPLGAVVLGAAGADVRVRVPVSGQRLDAIAALPEVAGVGAPPPELKADAGFAASARTQPRGAAVPAFVTLMEHDPGGRWRRELEAFGAVVGAWDPSVRTYAVILPFGALDPVLRADFVLAVEPMAAVRPAHDTAVPVMAADALRNWSSGSGRFTGRTGAAIPVGVMDSGLNLSHPDIATGRSSVCGRNFIVDEDYDLWRDLPGHGRGGGHGTHVTGTILGAGAENPLMAGMAPGVSHIRFAKVLPTRSGTGSTDEINRAMDYFAEASGCNWDGNMTGPVRPLLVNMSLASIGLGFSGRGVGERKLDATVWANRQLYVVAQANAGVHGVSNYATAKNSLAVGAAADTGVVASFSSHGPTADGRLAPNVVATGVDVWSVRGQGRTTGYARLDGTSMASPAVAGVAALLMDAEPGFREQPALTRARIMASAIRPEAFLDAGFAADNTEGPDEFQNRYGLGLASARLSVLQRDTEDGWTTGAALAELADNEYAYVDVDVPEGTDRLDVVMTWDEGPAEAVTESVLNDLDLWIDAGADCGPGACGDRSSRSRVDNVEWVVVKRPAPGVHRVKVTAERIHGDAPSAAVAWTLIRGDATPRLRIEPANAVVRAAADRPAEIELTVAVDGYVAAGSTLHLGARGSHHSRDIKLETAREDGLVRDWTQPFRDAISLGEVAAGEEQSVRLSITTGQSDRFYFTASAWNAEAGTASVDVIVDGDDRLPALAAVPENDRFDRAESISGRSGESTFDLMLASREPGEPDVFAQLSGSPDRHASLQAAQSRSVWFAWRAPDSGTWFFRVNEAGRAGDRIHGVNMAVFQGERIAALERVGTNDDSAIAFNAKRSQEYRIRVAATRPDVNPYLLRWEGGGDGPPNDDFAHRERITGLEGAVSGSNRGASLEPDEFFGDIASTVWYAWTAPEDGYRRFHAGNRRVHVFVGDTIADLRLVSSTRVSSTAVFPSAAGQTYRIVVGSVGTETAGGAFELTWESASHADLVDNDAFSDATPIDGNHGSVSGVELRGASVEDGEPAETGTQTRWWRWQPPGAGPYTLRLSGNDRTISVLNVFAGSLLGDLRRLAGGQELVIHTEPGESYSISVGRRHETSFQQRYWGDLGLSWGETPANDRPSGASALRGARGSVEASHRFATSSPDEPVAVAAHSSLWWRWTAPSTGWFRFRVEKRESLGPFGQSLLALYRIGAGGEPEFIRSTDHSYVLNGEPETALRAVRGARYLLQVAPRADQDAHTIRFTWEPAEPPGWLRYRGRVTDGEAFSAGDLLSIEEPRGLAIDGAGQRLFVNDRDKLIVLARDAETGSLSPLRTVPHRDADGNEVTGLSGTTLHWDERQGLLYGIGSGYNTTLYRLDDPAQAFVERCNDSATHGFGTSIEQVIAVGRFVYLIGRGGVLVYRMDGECDWTLVGILTEEPVDHVAAEQAAGVDRLRHAALGVEGNYLYILGEDALLTLARNPDTGKVSLRSAIDLDTASKDGSRVELPRSPTSIATDASGSFLFLFGNATPEIAVFDLRADPGSPALAAAISEFHIESWIFRTHLIWPQSEGHCSAFSTIVEAVTAICADAAYKVSWDADSMAFHVSDYIGAQVPDRFGNDVPYYGYPLDIVQSPDGRHLYALTRTFDGDLSIVAIEHSIAAVDGAAVDVPDPNLRAAIEQALGKATAEPITDVEMAGLARLDAARRGIVDLTGLESAYGLIELNLWGNRIADLSPLHGLITLERLDLGANRIDDPAPLAALDMLTWLNLGGNRIADISALDGLASLEYLGLHGNRITDLVAIGLPGLKELSLWGNGIRDVSALAGLTTLTRLDLARNRVENLEPLSGLVSLSWLDLSNNEVTDVSALAGLTELRELRLAGNRIADVAPLLENDGLRAGARIDLRGNPVERASTDAVAARGATVLQGAYHLPAADFLPTRLDPALQGFVRIVNRSSRPGEVRVLPIDESGAQAGQLWLFLDAGETAHFNSDDLETGNPGKGLSGRAGAGQGSWRLNLESGLPIELFTYIRTADGFLTAMHDVVPEHDARHRVAIFNPGGNLEQESFLRLVNTGASSADVVVHGVDDRSRTGKEPVRFTLAGGASRSVTAAQLESGDSQIEGALGVGTGKWRLDVEADSNVRVMNLLRSPTGHLSNLSTIPSETPGAGATVHQVPLFPSASDPLGREGFVRVINREPRSGEVRIDAYDDAGMAHGPVRLSIDAGAAVHFNSQDLESGNSGKGLAGSAGSGSGDWRLTLASDLDIDVLAYTRTHGGFLASMHDHAPLVGDRYRVATFNPASNDRQASLLRLTNPGDVPARLAVAGTDDSGRAGGSVSLTLEPGESRLLTASELERGGDGLGGSLGRTSRVDPS